MLVQLLSDLALGALISLPILLYVRRSFRLDRLDDARRRERARKL